MNRFFLVKLLGFPATLIQGNPPTLDRWLWLKKRLQKTVVVHSNDLDSERCIIVVDKIPNCPDMITQFFGKGK